MSKLIYHDDELDNLLEEKLNLIQPTMPRDPEIVRHRRNEYIREVQYLPSGKAMFTIAGLLNITDGLLGDCLNIQIICTFNTDIRRIDKALLRRGRLIALYEFRELTAEKSNSLLKHLKSDQVTSKEMILADIFNIDQPEFSYHEKGSVGFK